MAIPITVPRLGWNMEEGVFGGWLKADGDPIRPGDMLFRLESDKATEEIECLDAGILHIPPDGPKEGDRVPVGALIGHLVAAGEKLVLTQPAEQAPAASTSSEMPAPASRQRELPENGPAISPRARRAARELGVDQTGLNGSGRTGRIRERDVRAALSPSPPASGGEGLGVRGVEASTHGSLAPGPARPSPLTPDPSPPKPGRWESDGSLLPHTPTRRTIAARMAESQRATAPVTLTTAVDATNLVNLRQQYKSVNDGSPVPSYTDLLVKLSAVALQKHPALAGQWSEDGIRLPDAIHIGIAVDTDAGLLVPVVRDVPSVGVRRLAATSRDLIERARAGRLSAAETQGGCFTVTNLGAYGIDAFTPIINYPECAVLGVGRIAKRPAVVGDTIVGRDQMTLSLTFDHRIVDGAPAARFLQTLAEAIENPAPWLAT